MKIAAVVGTNADFSYNRLLLKFMQTHFKQIADIQLVEINHLPAFNADKVDDPDNSDFDIDAQTNVWKFKQALLMADGVIFSTPEYDHAITAGLKSAIEWASYKTDILDKKPAMIVGASYGPQGSARAQEHLRQILASPDVNAYVLPGNEVLIGNVASVITQDNLITDDAIVNELEKDFTHFVEYISAMDQYFEEDSSMSIKNPFINDAFVNFPTGRLTLKEIQQIFSFLPFEIDFIDADDRFAWFSDKPNREHVRSTKSLGGKIWDCHPPKAVPIVKQIIADFRSGKKDLVERPLVMHGHRSLIQYYAIRDVNGHYLGTMEFTGSVEHIARLVEAGKFGDVTTGASQHDATTGASQHSAIDTTTGASQHDEAVPEPAPKPLGPSDPNAPIAPTSESPDTTTGASEH